ncbi:hypothetical protein MMC16_004353 [Acarospora aff. strigata]|nr:hypothetical protein [Acarospora aff. strigata]
MSFLTRVAFRRAPVAVNASRGRMGLVANRRSNLHTTPVLAALSESDLGREDRDKEIDHHKEDQLQKQKEGKGHWKSELASNSEATVKADRGEVDASPDNIKKLQDETAEAAKADHAGEK